MRGRISILYMEEIMANQTTLALVATVAGLFVETTSQHIRAESIGGKLSAQMSELFAQCDTDDKFAEIFGNGINGKAHVPGLLRDAIEAKIAKMSKQKQEAVRNMIRVRFSEARKLRRAEGMPQKGESIQSALKRYQKPVEKQARPEGNTSGKVSIADDAGLDDIADALSIWVAKHGAASAGLVAKLADFLPVSVKRIRKAA
jgi:hypothetical protein